MSIQGMECIIANASVWNIPRISVNKYGECSADVL